MPIKVRNIVKACAFAGGSALSYIIIPYFVITYVQQNYPQIGLGQNLLNTIIMAGVVIVAASFFTGLFTPKTVKHAIAGIVYCACMAMYIYFVVGGASTGAFGIFSLSVDTAAISINVVNILTIILILVLANSLIYILELIQASRAKQAQAGAPIQP